MILRALAALAGTIAALLSPAAWPPLLVAVVAGLAVLCLYRGRLALAVACIAAVAAEHAILVQQSSMVREDGRVLVEARIVSLPVVTSQLAEFDVRARLTRRPGAPERALRVRWRGAPAGAPGAGETWQLALQLRVPRAQTNPGGIDGVRLLWRDHLAGRADVVDTPLNQRTDAQAPLLLRLRARVANRILERVPDAAAAALLAALAVGATGDVAREDWQVYNATGITHLIAISGMHVTLFAAVAMAGLRRAWGWWPGFARRVRRESFVAVAGVACAAAYTLLAGNSVPSQRTVLMLAAGCLWRALARSSTPGSSLAVALLAVLALDPFAILAAGFWLSFGAVGVILWREGARLGAPDGFRGAMRLQLAITAALVPATLASFGTLPLLGLLVNPVAIPLFSFVLVPLVLSAAGLLWLHGPAFVADALIALAGLVATPTQAALTRAAHGPIGVWAATPPLAWYAFSAIACLACLLPLNGRIRLLAVAALLPLLCDAERPRIGAWRVIELDAGALPVALVVTRRHALLFGTGDSHGTRGARVASTIVPVARSTGVRRVDRLVAGRMDADVAAGIGAVVALLEPGEVAAAPDREGRLPPRVADCASLARWEWDGVPFEALPGETPAVGCRLRIGGPRAALELDSTRRARSEARGAIRIDGDERSGISRRALRPGPGVWNAVPPGP